MVDDAARNTGLRRHALPAAWLAKLRQRPRFLRGKSFTVLRWTAVIVLLQVVGWSIALHRLDLARAQAVHDALADAGVVAKSHALHLQRTVDNVDQIILLVRDQWQSSGGQLRLEDFKSKGLFPEGAPFNVSIVNRFGMRGTNTFGANAESSNADVSTREYFSAQRDASADFLFFSTPTIGRTTGRPVIQFSRRLTDASGDFDGVVLLTVQMNYFTADYSESSLGRNGMLGAIGADRVARAIQIGDAPLPPQSVALVTLPAVESVPGTLLLAGTWFPDRRSRFTGWEPVSGYPLISIAALDEDESLEPYAARRATVIRTGIAGSIALTLFAYTGMILTLLLTWRREELRRFQTTYRMATERGSEGFYIALPLRDAGGAITDFEAVDCNERGAAFFHYKRKEFIARRVSDLADRRVRQEVLQRLRQAMEEGQSEGEITMDSQTLEHGRCVSLQAVRSGEHLAVTLRDITRERQYMRELERRGNHDVLTGLPNRLWVNGYLPTAIDHAHNAQSMLAVLFIDLDGFKSINDSLGHAAGDEVLRNAARRMQDAVRPGDHVVRLGGDEFLVIIENIHAQEDAAHVAHRVLEAFEENFGIPQGVASIGTSIGISVYPQDAKDAAALLQNADVAMYAAKTSGKHRFQFFDRTFYDALRARLAMEEALRHAIEEDQFVMLYQPRVDMASGKAASMEALVRWAHPTKGLIEPLEFIPLAEANGLILELGKLTIHKVCRQVSQWARSGEPLVPVSINVSSRQFNDSNIAATLAEALQTYRVDPGLIELELTESTMMGNTEKISGALATIHGLGIKLSVDDFGTGYSSLSQLQRLDFDVLKVDRSFTAELGRTTRGNVFFSAIITMAHALGMRVVAEGVENAVQRDLLRALQCDEIQGFLVSRPLAPADAREAFLAELAMKA